MCGYDPFKWADAYDSEEEYLQELIKDQKEDTTNDVFIDNRN